VKHALQAITGTMRAPVFSGDNPIRFGVVQYELIIANAGSPDAFTVAHTVADEFTVMHDSSANVRHEVLTSPRFVSKVDRTHWQAGGRQPYASSTDLAGASSHEKINPGDFGFTPHGRTVTFEQVRSFPAAPKALAQELGRFLGSGSTPALSLRQYGFLLATAPLTRSARKALLEAIGALPRVYGCSALFPRRSLHDYGFCINGDPTSTEILIDRHTGAAVVVSERLDASTPLYPNVAAGALVDSYTFSLQPPTS
jgi:hypothetical protein